MVNRHNVDWSVQTQPARGGLIAVPPQMLLQSFAEPRGKTCLLYGDRAVYQLAHRISAHAATTSAPVAIVDGANRFDIQAVVRYARERRTNPDVLLNRLFISRGFTCYQVEAAIVERLPLFLKSINSGTACIFGLLDTFYDEAAKLRDVHAILQRIIRALHAMSANGISILLTSTEWNVLPKERNRLFAEMKRAMDLVYRLDVHPEKSLQLYAEQPRRISNGHLLGKGGGKHGKNRPNVYKHY